MASKDKPIFSAGDVQTAKEYATSAKGMAKTGIKHTLGIGFYSSETDAEIGRSKEHTKHMKKTRRRNFARKMKLIDPHYGKKAAGILVAGTALGLAATFTPGVGTALGPAVGGSVIAGGLVFLETDAHRAVGDHAILDSLLDDRDDNWRTNTGTAGYNGHGDNVSEFDRQTMLAWSDEDSDDDDLDDLLPSSMERESKNEKNSNNPLFDALDSYSESTPEPSDFFSSMESLGLSDSNSPSVPRPPSPQGSPRGANQYQGANTGGKVAGGEGQRFTNPHSSKQVQDMGNSTSGSDKTAFDLFKGPQDVKVAQPDDFFASFNSPSASSSGAISPTPASFFPDVPTTLNQKPATQEAPFDFFAAQPNQQSFFSTPEPVQQPPQPKVDTDPFADLYTRPAPKVEEKPAPKPTPSNHTPAANYSGLQNMRRY